METKINEENTDAVEMRSEMKKRVKMLFYMKNECFMKEKHSVIV